MSGRWLVDIAATTRAARAVLSKHAALRTQEWAVYAQTSSLVVAVQRRADRVISQAVQASSGLNAQARLASQKAGPATTAVPRRDSVPGRQTQRDRHCQDRHDEQLQANQAAQPPHAPSLGVIQEKASTQPLPDGTIPEPVTAIPSTPSPGSFEGSSQIPSEQSSAQVRVVQRQAETRIPLVVAKQKALDAVAEEAPDVKQERDVHYELSTGGGPVLSPLPRVKVPSHSETAQDGDRRVPDKGIDQDVYYASSKNRISPGDSRSETFGGQDGDIPEEIASQIFQSPRVGRMMARRGDQGKQENPYNTSHPANRGRSPPQPQPEETQSATPAQIEVSTPSKAPQTSDPEVQDLAESLAGEAPDKVRVNARCTRRMLMADRMVTDSRSSFLSRQ